MRTGSGSRFGGAIVIDISAWDANCPQHITPRFTERDLKPVVQELTDRIAELQAELAALKNDRV